jgi:uncharacterized membrane protein
MEAVRTSLGFVKTTILGGVLFLLPFAVVVFLLGQVVALIYPAIHAIQERLPGPSISLGVVSSATVLAAIMLLAICYFAGRIAQRSFAARFAARFEKSLLLLFPRYAIWKNAMASNLGGQLDGAATKPVLVTFDAAARVGFETARSDAGLVTVYLPSAPDPWSGQVVHVPADRVAPLAVDFGVAVAVCESLGRQANRVIDAAGSPPVALAVNDRGFNGGSP